MSLPRIARINTDLISFGNGVGTQPVPIFREIARINTDGIPCGNGVARRIRRRRGFPAGMGLEHGLDGFDGWSRI